MLIASWNVNSIKVRLPQLLNWLAQAKPDVVCLQELKCETELFPFDALGEAGYEAAAYGQKAYNGVAILSRLPIENPVEGFAGEEGQARLIEATINGITVLSCYAPNGQAVGSDKFAYNTPINDFGLTFKAGSLAFGNDFFMMGGLINFNLPVGDSYKQNVPFQIFRGVGFNYQIQGLLSYYSDNLFPEDAFSAHLNLGFGNSLDKNKEVLFNEAFGKGEKPIKGTTDPLDIRYGFGVKLPTSFLDFYTEIWGNAFITEPDPIYYAHENYGYITAGLGLKPVDLLLLNVSGDFLFTGSEDKSFRTVGGGTTSLINSDANYAPWRINIGLKINILPLKTSYTIDPSRRYDITPREADEIRRRVRIIEENEAVTRDKVETLRTKRKDVEANLKQLRDLLRSLDTQGGEGN